MDCIKQRDGRADRVGRGTGRAREREGELDPTRPGTLKGTPGDTSPVKRILFRENLAIIFFAVIIKCIANNRLNRFGYASESIKRALLCKEYFIKSTFTSSRCVDRFIRLIIFITRWKLICLSFFSLIFVGYVLLKSKCTRQ